MPCTTLSTRRLRWGRLAAVLVSLGVALGGCRDAPPSPAEQPSRATTPQRVDPRWVTVFDPRGAQSGYTLTLHEMRTPVLLDLNGRVVHAWRGVKMKSRVRLLPDGAVLGIGVGRQVVEHAWNGEKTWEFRTEGALPHHDVIRLANGNTLVVTLPEKGKADVLLEVNRTGQVVWRWVARERLGALMPKRPPHPNDITHINSVQELPPNPWFAAGDERFRPGNILVSARNLDTIFIIARPSGDIVWSYRAGLDRQHEALLYAADSPRAGLIAVFNNRLRSFASDRQSEVIEIDPRRVDPAAQQAGSEVVWRYRTLGFFTPTAGTQQALPNGNFLLTSTRGGRVFETTRDGQVVWEWMPTYEPVRALRVAPDACPQLANVTRQPLVAVSRPASLWTVDRDVYRFAKRGSRKNAVVNGAPRTLLSAEVDCRELLLPSGAQAALGFGVDAGRLVSHLEDFGANPPTFTLDVTPLSPAGAPQVVRRETVTLHEEPWRQRTVSLARWALTPVKLCVRIDGVPLGRPWPQRIAYWEQPDLNAPSDLVRKTVTGLEGLTGEALEVQKKHLEALGYVN